jgi:anthranilate phosphoribosyltransferase
MTTTLTYMAEALKFLAEGRDLPVETARGAMAELMEGRATEAQIGAFLIGLRLKGETADEIAAFARVMREKSVQIHPKPRTEVLLTDVCGTGGAKLKTFNVSTLTAFVAAGAGVPIAKHGNRGVTSPCGSADLLERLGVSLDTSPEIVERCIEEIGVGFLFAPRFHPAMKHAAPVRKALGVRTVFNLLGPLTNPAGVRAQLLGGFDPALVELYPRVLRGLGVERALVAHGVEGLDELSTVGTTLVGELRDTVIDYYELRPEALGLKRATPEAVGALPPEESAQRTLDLLQCRRRDERYEMLLLSAGAAVYVSGGAPSLEDGLARAEESLRSGAAYEKLRQLVERTRAQERSEPG